MNREELQSVLKQPYQRDRWLELLRAVLPGTDVFASPQAILATKSNAESILQLGRVRLHGGRQLAVLESTVAEGLDLTRNRVGLRNQVARLIDLAEYHGILAVFHSTDSEDYRFTFAARESVFDAEGTFTKRETSPRRYTYVLGPNESCRTAAERFSHLSDKAHGVELDDIIEAFSVEKLNKEFFSAFCRAFDRVRAEMSDRRQTWKDATIKSEAQTLLNRLLFLYFVQRKGWLNRQRDYLIGNFRSVHQDKPKASTYHSQFLQPLFQRLSTEDAPALLSDHDLPFLNGGLFNDEYGEELFKHHSDFFLSNETYDYIFDNLLEPYNFTIHEDSPNNYEVAIDPEMLGRIFEALVLQGEESDARGKSVRHDTGSHYTPRSIVHYVCRNTLAAWLAATPPFTSGNDARRRIDQLFELDATEGFDEEMRLHLDDCLTTNEAAALRDRLFELRACDPAVGSGAFPMGLLHELLNLLRLCEARARGKDPAERDPTWLYETKKHVIEYALYGVDIQERAIEICKLRLWLSLMVDHELDVDPFNCDPRSFKNALKSLDPLPNLDFKIRCANSLMDYIHGQVITLSAHNSSDRIRPTLSKLITAKQAFYEAHTAKEKRRLRFVIYEATAELAKFELGWARTQAGLIASNSDAERAQKALAFVFEQIKDARGAKVAQQENALERIQSWFDDRDKRTFVWQLDFAEVFHRYQNDNLLGSSQLSNSDETAPSKPVRNGFDLMIGNPPYVRIQTLTKADPDALAYYKQHYIAARKGSYDLYVVFVERGLALLDERHGQLGYILPHKFFNAEYGEPLRGLLSRGKHLRHIVHFGDHQIFPGATNYVCLLFLTASNANECRFVRADDLRLWLATQQGTEGQIPAERITEAKWNFAVGRGADLFERLRRFPLTLGEVTSRMFQGPITSADSVYLFKKFKTARNGSIEVCSKELDQTVAIESDILKRVVRSGDIERYHAEATALVLFPYEVRNNTARLYPSSEMRRLFPLAWAYLSKNKGLLAGREEGSFQDDQWYRFGRTQNLGMWEQPKLLVPYMVAELSAYLDEEENFYFINVTTGGYGITTDGAYGTLTYLCGLLNSSVLNFFFKRVSTTFHGGYFAANKQFIEQLPIPDATANQRVAIELLVDQLLWLRRQPSVTNLDASRPQDPAMTSFFEQVINALVYELFFADELHSSTLHLFDLVHDAKLPLLNSLPSQKSTRLQALFDLFQKLQAPGHPLRIALDKLQTLDLVRTIEGKP